VINYLVWIYMPKDRSYDFAGFTTSNISDTLGGLSKTAATDGDAMAILNSIRAHEFVNYAQSPKHDPTVGIAIRRATPKLAGKKMSIV